MVTPWPDIPLNQIITFDDIKTAIANGYLTANNRFPGDLDLSELCSKSNFEFFCSNGVDKTLAPNQMVPRGAVDA